MLPKLQYISQGNSIGMHIQNIEEALEAGVRFIQLRLKDVSLSAYKDGALQVKQLCDAHQALLVINDEVEVAQFCNANALHLGLDDANVEDARLIFSDKIIGGSTNNLDHIIQRNREGVDYIGLGPFQFTSTKTNLNPILGIEGYQKLLKEMHALNIKFPVYAIGGIAFEDIKNIISTGVYGIAVSGLITNAKDKKQLVKEINEILYHV